MIEFFIGESQGIKIPFDSEDGQDLKQALKSSLGNCINIFSMALKNPGRFKRILDFSSLPNQDGLYKSQFGPCYVHLVNLESISWINDLYLVLIVNPEMPEAFNSPDTTIIEQDEDGHYIDSACIFINLAKLRSYDKILMATRHELTHIKQMLEDKDSGMSFNTRNMNYYETSKLLQRCKYPELAQDLHYMNMYLTKMEREAYLSDADFDVEVIADEYKRLVKSGRNPRQSAINLLSNYIKKEDLLQDNFIKVVSDGLRNLRRYSNQDVPREFQEELAKKLGFSLRRGFMKEFSEYAERILNKVKIQRDKWFYNKVNELESLLY